MIIMSNMPPKVRSVGLATVLSIGFIGQYLMIEVYLVIRGGINPKESGHSKWLELIWSMLIIIGGIAITGYWFLYPKITVNDKPISNLRQRD